MKKCPNCGIEVADEAKYCSACGASLTKKEPRVVDAKVEPIKEDKKEESTSRVSRDEKLIEQYEKEIEVLSRRRRIMITWGIILGVVGIVGIIAFTLVLTLGLVREIPQADNNPEVTARIVGLSIFYYLMIVLCSFMVAGGVVLIPLGAVPNSIKITKRENKIRMLRK